MEIPGIDVLPSDANFITFRLGVPAEGVWKELNEKGVSVRLVREIPGRGSCLRVTIAPEPMLSEFIRILRETLS